jgi:predicted transcriptional regulator
MSKTITIRLTHDLTSWLDRASKQSGISRGRFIREQLAARHHKWTTQIAIGTSELHSTCGAVLADEKGERRSEFFFRPALDSVLSFSTPVASAGHPRRSVTRIGFCENMI